MKMNSNLKPAAVISLFTVLVVIHLCSADSYAWRPHFPIRRYREGEPTYISTLGDYEWSKALYVVEGRHNFVFSVKSCSAAIITLAYKMSADDDAFVIELGSPDVNTSKIWNYRSPDVHFTTHTYPVLHCHEYRTFWIQWIRDNIEVGRGPSIGEQKFMNVTVEALVPIYTVGLTAGAGISAVWQVNENNADFLMVETPAEYKYSTIWKAVMNREYFPFSVRACGDVHLVLSSELGKTDQDIYEFSIGGWQNNKTVIRTGLWGGGEYIKAEHSEKYMVDCTLYKDFWIGWYNQSLMVGRGHIYGMDTILSWYDSGFQPVRYLGLTTGFGNAGSWILNEYRETVSHIATPAGDLSNPPHSLFNTSFLEMPYRRFLPFEVKTAGVAYIILMSHHYYIDEEFDIVITFGSGENTKICVEYLFEPGCIVEKEMPRVLYEDTFIAFWMSWHDDKLKIGLGYLYNENVLLDDEKLNMLGPVITVGMATTGATGWWKVRDNVAEVQDYYTPDYFHDFQANTVWRNIENKKSTRFEIMAANDAHIALSPVTGHNVSRDTWYYSVVIGGWGNTESAIRQSNGLHDGAELRYFARVETAGILKANEYVDIWISWWDNHLKVGTGPEEGVNTIMEYTFQDIIDIRAMAISTGWGSKGHWKLLEDVGDNMRMMTNGTLNTKQWMSDIWLGFSSNFTFHTFRVMGCKDAVIHISSAENSGSVDPTITDHFKIIVGAEESQKVVLYQEGQLVGTYDAPAVLSCTHARDFWIKWGVGKLEFGRGYVYPDLIFFEHTHDKTEYNITTMGFTSDPANLVKWQIRHSWYEPFFNTPAEYGYNHVWTEVEHAEDLAFAVKAGSDVHILLSERNGFIYGDWNTRHGYEMVISGWENTQSVIREHVVDEHGDRMVHRAQVATPNLINAGNYTPFAITWNNGAIVLNKFWYYPNKTFSHVQKILDYHPIRTFTIRAMAFSTGYGYEGQWVVNVIGEIIAPGVDEQGPAVPPVDGPNSPKLSGGSIAGIVLGVLLMIALIGVAATILLAHRGVVETPRVLQTPVEGSGFSNPSAGEEGAVGEVDEVSATDRNKFEEVVY